MVTPIDAVRFHSTFGEADFWFRGEARDSLSELDERNLAPARGAVLGIAVGGLLWVGLIAAFRAVLSL